ncbi:MAG TPA: trypsin-like peptidase domain-containing protein [Blastocatellia bacterium]
MKESRQAEEKSSTEMITPAHHRRVVTVLVALLCLSVGIAIGAVLRGGGLARGNDNRLSLSNTRPAMDALSASFARVAQEVEPCVVNIKMSNGYQLEGTGSGVIVNPDGYILTNAHVVNGATRLRVKLSDGSESEAKVIGVDQPTDLAVIKIDVKKPLPAARLGDSDKLAVGDWVLAIGSPFGLEQTVTAGIISAKDRDTEQGSTPFQKFLQTDAAINPGNSGGPLVNLAGEVIGINTQIATSTGAYSGIGFALPASTAADTYNQLIASGRVRRGYLGVELQELTPQIVRINKLADGQGVVIKDTLGDASPALRAGMRSGDVITSINNQKVKSIRELIRKIAALAVGSVANITYVRAGEMRTAAVTLEERQDKSGERQEMKLRPTDPRDPYRIPGLKDKNQQSDKPKPKPSLGINVRTLTEEIARQTGLEGTRGAFVVSVDPGSVADENGISQDDLIIEINNRPVASAEDFQRIIRELRSGDDVVIKVLHRPQSEAIRHAWIVSLTMP